jgi:TonB family protein
MKVRSCLVWFFSLSCCIGLAGFSHGQEVSAESGRKVVRRVEPRYPEIAKKMSISGTVKVFAVVAPDGTVKAVEPVGGSPLLVQASQLAVKEWRFAPGATESKELIALHFVQER